MMTMIIAMTMNFLSGTMSINNVKPRRVNANCMASTRVQYWCMTNDKKKRIKEALT